MVGQMGFMQVKHIQQKILKCTHIIYFKSYTGLKMFMTTDIDNQSLRYIFVCNNQDRNVINYPSELIGNQCLVIQLLPGASYSAQLAFSFQSRKIALRNKQNGTWNNWVYFLAS